MRTTTLTLAVLTKIRSFIANVLEIKAPLNSHAQNITTLTAFIPTRNSFVRSLGLYALFISN